MNIQKFLAFAFVLLWIVGCSHRRPATAIVQINVGDSPPGKNTVTGTDSDFLKTDILVGNEIAILKSDLFLGHVDRVLRLSGLWAISSAEAESRLDKMITVKAGPAPGQIVIEVQGAGHRNNVNILSALCAFYTNQEIYDSSNGGPEEKRHVVIIRPAE